MRALLVVKSQKCTPSFHKSWQVIGVRTLSSVVSNSNTSIVSKQVATSSSILSNSIVNTKNGTYNTNFDSPWPTFGTVIGLTSALAVGGLYIEQQQQQSQENQLEQTERKISITNINTGSNEISSSSSSSTSFQNNISTIVATINNNDDKYPVDKKQQPQQQQQSVYSFGDIRLLSTSPSATSTTESLSSSDTPGITGGVTSPDNEEFIDIYDNLPETDPPTNCSVCNTYRKGPCRNQWRKSEYCMKDNEGKEIEEFYGNCRPYLVRHLVCENQYSNLYDLIRLDGLQEYFDTLENDINKSDRRYWPCSKSNPIVHMDWGNWPDFVSEASLNFTQLTDVKNTTNSSTVPLYKRFPEGLDPVILSGTASIPRTLNDTNNTKEQNKYVLSRVWVTDQDGMVLGRYFSKKYGALYEQLDELKNPDNVHEAQPNSNKDDGKEQDDEPQEDDERCICTFSIIPGSTKQVIVHGMYSENPLQASPTKEVMDKLVYTSKPYCMKKASTERTKQD